MPVWRCRLSQSSWRLDELLSTKPRFTSTADCHRTMLKICDWQKVFISLALNNGGKLPPKDDRFQTLQILFSSSLFICIPPSKKKPKKKKKSRPDLLRYTQTNAATAIFRSYLYPSAAPFFLWSAEIKVAYGCHRGASHSGRLAAARRHLCPTHSWRRRRSGRDNLKLLLFKGVGAETLQEVVSVSMAWRRSELSSRHSASKSIAKSNLN